ncbi:MAG: mRNA-degrading endonuclease [Candidatus Eremiobacteraeota bacterium]|uniref:Toxin of the ChpA-ChpR toxin-antitoxin system,endoribonuclease n=1 Tax=mine drainage metagenome TaxID=410659 RepID=E6Q481_9ZZZZ|nr:type II toxin-antitoxin system PemK/MazF family toxin [Candidatus Eremiobacteraeota bacterium]NNM93568.1 mRNA-degrading endonuclease [Candidatus Eremiobacteraeota bacterium]
MIVPDRGDIVVLDFDPQVGHEQIKRRPALVLSPTSFNRVFGLAFVAPVTSKPKGHAFEIALPQECGVTGSVMMHQLKSLDWQARRSKKVGVVSAEILESAAEIVREIVS